MAGIGVELKLESQKRTLVGFEVGFEVDFEGD
jgi:hypothetical protein